MNLTTKRAAKRLGVSAGTVTKWMHEGKLKPVGKKGTSFLYDSKSIDSFNGNSRVPSVKVFKVHKELETYSNGLTGRLQRIETKLDQLIKVLS